MARVVGDIAVQVGADVSGLQAGMDKAGRSVKDFEGRAAKMGRTFGKVAVAITAATVAAGVGIARMAKTAGETAREIEKLSTISGVGVEEFQRYSAASRNVGIEQEKLGDIFKDVNDKFGDFMATGAGPLADFFENIAPAVGVTADQFAKLSGPEALQLYVTSLERAGVSQQQMTFYMEALASDATALLPLLKNNGTAMRAYGDEAQRAGQIMSRDTIVAASELDRKLTDLGAELRTKVNTAIAEYSDEIIAAATFITDDLIPAISSFITWIGDFAASLQPAIDTLTRFISLGQTAMGLGDGGAPAVLDESVRRNDVAGANALGGGDTSTTGTWALDENGNVIMDDGEGPLVTAPPPPTVTPVTPRSGSSRSGGGGGGGGRGPAREDFEALQEQYLQEAEFIAQQREDALEKLREYREAKLGTEQEYNDLEARINAEHLESMARVEEDAQRARLQAMSGALGDLASLMASENKKLFKIGQAAAIADAVVNGYSAAVAAWDKGMKVGGPPVAAAFTAASLARTGALISGIASANSSGSGAAGAVGAGGSAAASETAPVERRVAEISVQGDFISTETFFDLLNDGFDQGYTLKAVRT